MADAADTSQQAATDDSVSDTNVSAPASPPVISATASITALHPLALPHTHAHSHTHEDADALPQGYAPADAHAYAYDASAVHGHVGEDGLEMHPASNHVEFESSDEDEVDWPGSGTQGHRQEHYPDTHGHHTHAHARVGTCWGAVADAIFFGLNARATQVVLFVFTIYILFANDVRLIAFDVSADTAFEALSFMCMCVFILEMAARSMVETSWHTVRLHEPPEHASWFQRMKARVAQLLACGTGRLRLPRGYLFSFLFFLDLLAIVSLLPEIDTIWNAVVTDVSATASLNAARASRVSRFGSRLGRLLRMVRIVKLFKLYSLWRAQTTREARLHSYRHFRAGATRRHSPTRSWASGAFAASPSTGQGAPPAGANVALSGGAIVSDVTETAGLGVPLGYVRESQIGQRLASATTRTIILLVLVLLLLLPLVTSTPDEHGPSTAVQVLHDFNVARSPGWDTAAAGLIRRFRTWARDDAVLLQSDIGAPRLVKMHLEPAAGVPLYAELDLPHVYDSLRTSFSSGEIEKIEFATPVTAQMASKFPPGTTQIVTQVWFSIRPVVRINSLLAILLTILIIVVLLVGALQLMADAHVLVLRPLENMIAFVERIALDPTSGADMSSRGNTGSYETKVLENTLKKIVGVLRVGFGSAGVMIVAKHLQNRAEQQDRSAHAAHAATAAALNTAKLAGELRLDPSIFGGGDTGGSFVGLPLKPEQTGTGEAAARLPEPANFGGTSTPSAPPTPAPTRTGSLRLAGASGLSLSPFNGRGTVTGSTEASLFDAFRRGRLVRAVFVRIHIPHFDTICEVRACGVHVRAPRIVGRHRRCPCLACVQILGERVISFTNKIAKVVHDTTLSWGGAPIANAGHGFLCVWVVDDAWSALLEDEDVLDYVQHGGAEPAVVASRRGSMNSISAARERSEADEYSGDAAPSPPHTAGGVSGRFAADTSRVSARGPFSNLSPAGATNTHRRERQTLAVVGGRTPARLPSGMALDAAGGESARAVGVGQAGRRLSIDARTDPVYALVHESEAHYRRSSMASALPMRSRAPKDRTSATPAGRRALSRSPSRGSPPESQAPRSAQSSGRSTPTGKPSVGDGDSESVDTRPHSVASSPRAAGDTSTAARANAPSSSPVADASETGRRPGPPPPLSGGRSMHIETPHTRSTRMARPTSLPPTSRPPADPRRARAWGLMQRVATEVAERALIACIKCIAAVDRSPDVQESEELLELKASERLRGYRLRLEFGVHAGWAVEAAIGSAHKADPYYMSAHVDMAAKLQALAPAYGAQILMSGTLVQLLGTHARGACRKIDVVELPKGTASLRSSDGSLLAPKSTETVAAVSLYVFDVWDYSRTIAAPRAVPSTGKALDALLAELLPLSTFAGNTVNDADVFNRRHKKMIEHDRCISILGAADIIDHPIVVGEYTRTLMEADADVWALRAPFSADLRAAHTRALQLYLCGSWEQARDAFHTVARLRTQPKGSDSGTLRVSSDAAAGVRLDAPAPFSLEQLDPPSQVVYMFISHLQFRPPTDWRGRRRL